MSSATGRNSRRIQRGQLIQVRSHSEILATLDSDGKTDGLPFMPEMAEFCGRQFRVFRRAEKVYLDYYYYVARMRRAVFLEGVRCDGRAHAGCQMACLIFWNEAWLRPVDDSRQAGDDSCAGDPGEMALPTVKGGRFCCQATELVTATSRLPWWHLGQYLRDRRARGLSLGRMLSVLLSLAYNKVRWVCGLREVGMLRGEQLKTTNEPLNLQPGELVRVKNAEEIKATLDCTGRNRGLGLPPGATDHCGRTYRVVARPEKIITEWTGQMRQISNTVILEGVTCDGMARRYCPRDCYHLWREIWLEREP
jgi:hypothetical protein